MRNIVLPVGQLTALIKTVVEEDDDLQDVWVDGEISNLSIAGSGHAYFTLKDDQSQLRAVMWRSSRTRQSIDLKHGDRVIAHGQVTVYQARGDVQLQVDVIQPHGTGLLNLKLERLRLQLEAEGLFDPSRKRPLPPLPDRIGVVTSSSGAAWHDIQQVLARRYPIGELVLSPALVQGTMAPLSIVDALAQLVERERPDVIIIGRGGGSLEDLWAFNDERVIRAIFACPVPVISAVGHETDWTLSDDVADRRAPTPSAAAELVAPDLGTLDDELAQVQVRLTHIMARWINDLGQRIDDLQGRLGRVTPIVALDAVRLEIAALGRRLAMATGHVIERHRCDVNELDAALRALNPKAVLERGYAVVRSRNGSLVRSVTDVREGDRLNVQLHDGAFNAVVGTDSNC